MFAHWLSRVFRPAAERSSSLPVLPDMPAAPAKPVRVLAVSYDSSLLFQLNLAIKAAGYEIMEATTGAEALRLARAHPPDIVLADTILPDMQGLELCRQVKSDSGVFRAITVVLSRPPLSHESLNAGADAFVPVNIEGSAFIARLQSLLRSAPSTPRRMMSHSPGSQRKFLVGAEARPDSAPRTITIESSPTDPAQLPPGDPAPRLQAGPLLDRLNDGPDKPGSL